MLVKKNYSNRNVYCYSNVNIICFGFKKTNREISTTSGEIKNLFFQKFILQTKLQSNTSSVLK